MKDRLNYLLSAFLVATLTLFSGCKSDDPEPNHEQELITTIELIFQPLNELGEPENEPLSFTWKDLDGPGPNAPIIDDISLVAHKSYRLSINLFDESKTPVEDISEEVLEEGADHQFFFTVSGVDLEINYDDTDENGRPIGLENLVTTDHEGEGTFKVVLIHEPNKSAAGVSNGNPANAGGETDVEAVFSLLVVE